MKLFKKPNWLRPEINEGKYWLHIIIIALVVLGILQLLFGGDMFNIKNILISSSLIAIGDIFAHTVLGFD